MIMLFVCFLVRIGNPYSNATKFDRLKTWNCVFGFSVFRYFFRNLFKYIPFRIYASLAILRGVRRKAHGFSYSVCFGYLFYSLVQLHGYPCKCTENKKLLIFRVIARSFPCKCPDKKSVQMHGCARLTFPQMGNMGPKKIFR